MATSSRLYDFTWYHSKSQHCRNTVPVVCLMTWLFAKAEHVSKQVKLYNLLGCDVLVCSTPALSMWFPQWASFRAQRIISTLYSELKDTGNRPVVFVICSGAAKGCYYKLLQGLTDLASEAACLVSNNLAGHILDSCPVDFSSEKGAQLLLPTSNTITAGVTSRAVWFAAGVLDFLFFEAFERQRNEFWSTLRRHLSNAPILCIYSWSDRLADPLLIHQLASDIKQEGGEVFEQSWSESPHVSHLRQHPQAYEDAVRHFVDQVLSLWSTKQSNSSLSMFQPSPIPQQSLCQDTPTGTSLYAGSLSSARLQQPHTTTMSATIHRDSYGTASSSKGDVPHETQRSEPQTMPHMLQHTCTTAPSCFALPDVGDAGIQSKL